MPPRDFQTRVPPRGAPAFRRLGSVSVYAAVRNSPRDHRVRVPHVARRELIASPHRRRNAGYRLEHATRAIVVLGQSPRAVDGLDHVRDVAVQPQTDLVAKDPKPAGQAAADGTLGHDAPLVAAQVRDRGLLDDVLPFGDLDLQRGVVEVVGRAPLKPRRHGLVEAPVEPDEVTAGTEGQPVEVDRGIAARLAYDGPSPFGPCQSGTVLPSGGIGRSLSMRARWTTLWAIQPAVLRV